MHNHIESQAETTPDGASGRLGTRRSLPARLCLAAARLRDGDSRQV